TAAHSTTHAPAHAATHTPCAPRPFTASGRQERALFSASSSNALSTLRYAPPWQPTASWCCRASRPLHRLWMRQGLGGDNAIITQKTAIGSRHEVTDGHRDARQRPQAGA